jgi:hypothetical protein
VHEADWSVTARMEIVPSTSLQPCNSAAPLQGAGALHAMLAPACSSVRRKGCTMPGGPCSARRAPANTRGGERSAASSTFPGCGGTHLPAAVHA